VFTPASVPLSGFLNPSAVFATPGFRGLVSCRNRSWDLPSECSPRKDRRRLSTPPCSLAVIHPPAVAHCLRLITAGFADAHAFAQLPGSPSDYELPFNMPEGTRPGHSGLKQQTALYSALHRLRSLTPLTSPFAIDLSCPSSTAVTLLGFSPLKLSPTTARSLEPTRATRTRTLAFRPSPPKGPATRARDRKDFQGPVGPLPPPRPGRTRLAPESAKSTLSADSSSCMKPARTTSQWPLLLPESWIIGQAQRS
jgi:hypothetical protein